MLPGQLARAPGTPSQGFLPGFLSGVTPVGIFAGGLLLTAGVGAVVRGVLLTSGFAVQQSVEPLVFAMGLLLATVGGVVGGVRLVARMRQWEASGEDERVRGSRWGLIVTAFLLAAPVILAVLWPQHPAVAG
jgi:hypothetical protein